MEEVCTRLVTRPVKVLPSLPPHPPVASSGPHPAPLPPRTPPLSPPPPTRGAAPTPAPTANAPSDKRTAGPPHHTQHHTQQQQQQARPQPPPLQDLQARAKLDSQSETLAILAGQVEVALSRLSTVEEACRDAGSLRQEVQVRWERLDARSAKLEQDLAAQSSRLEGQMIEQGKRMQASQDRILDLLEAQRPRSGRSESPARKDKDRRGRASGRHGGR